MTEKERITQLEVENRELRNACMQMADRIERWFAGGKPRMEAIVGVLRNVGDCKDRG